ncbi:NPP1 family protein [Kribbella sp. CWNU-51]
MQGSEPYRAGRFRNLRRWPLVIVMAVAMLAGSVTVSQQASANTGLVAVPGDLTNFVIAGAPTWYFARANSHDACWPSPAFVGANNDQHPPAATANWPDTNKGCAPTWSWFPTYYNVKTCYGTEVRVVYTIYFPKDGFNPSGANGHPHDFEHVTVIWRYAGNNEWKRAVLVMGRHGWEYPKKWADVETLTIQDNEGTYGHNGDFPQAYVGFAKHQMFNDKTGYDKSATGGATPAEYRSSDYRYTPRNFVPVTDTNYWGQKFLQYNWGEASSNPAKMYQDICKTRWSDLGY